VPTVPDEDQHVDDAAARAGAMERALTDLEPTNPLVRPQIAGKEIFERLLAVLRDGKGVHLESLATILGALGGYACQQAALDGLARRDSAYDGRSTMSVGTADGGTYLAGSALHWPLGEAPYSFWGLVAGMAGHLGSDVPDLHEAVAHSAQTLGRPEFGIPRYAPGANSTTTPREALLFWTPLGSTLFVIATNPQHWPIAYGLAGQHLLQAAAARPGVSNDLTAIVRVMIDAALATSKITDAVLAPDER
jgi:hypothetical protein